MSRFVTLLSAILHEDAEEVSRLALDLQPNELNSALLRCVMLSENTDLLNALLAAGANVNHQDDDGRTAVFLAVKFSRVDMMEELIRRGCNVNIGKYNQSNCLHMASRRGNAGVVQSLVDAGHSLNAVNWGGNTPVLIACRFGHKEVVDKLLTSGADINIPNKLGHYPLHYAAFTGDVDLVATLIRSGARPDVRTHLGISPIMLSTEHNFCNMIELLAGECCLGNREQLYGGNVLHWAVASGCETCVDHLLSCGARLDATDDSGRTPLLQAIQSNHPKIVSLILSRSDKNSFEASNVNSNAIHFAACLGRSEIVEILCVDELTKRFVNGCDFFDDAPLDVACAVLERGDGKESLKDMLDVIDVLQAHGGKRSSGSTSPSYHRSLRKEELRKLPLVVVAEDAKRDRHDNLFDWNRRGDEFDEINSNSDLLRRHGVVDDIVVQDLSIVDVVAPPQTSFPPIFKTYSRVKMALIGMLRSAPSEQMVAPVKFNFSTWLDNGPEAFVLKVTSLDMTEWLYKQTHNAWPLKELCRGVIRFHLGYRAHDKIARLPIPTVMKDYLNLRELDEVRTADIQIRNTGSYGDIDIE